MKTSHLWILAPLATAALCAQDPQRPTPQAPPNPKTEAHLALRQWVGTWSGKGQMEAMPGVPGMEEPISAKGTETGTLICDGLWLKWESAMTGMGDASTGLWLVGYDPKKKQYVSYAISSDPNHPGMIPLTGEHNKKTNTWTWVGETPQGKMKSVCVFSGPDRMKETIYSIDKDGKEKQFMVMTRVRSRGDTKGSLIEVPKEKALANPAARQVTGLLRSVGSWTGQVEMQMGLGAPVQREACSERVTAILGGLWTWSAFKGKFMGHDFVGHALTGWDNVNKRYACLWIDSTVAGPTVTTGKYDKKKRVWSLAGSGPGPDGNPMQITQQMSQRSDDRRDCTMKFMHPLSQMTMKISYARKGKSD